MSPETRLILESNNYLVLSTFHKDAGPWGSPLHFAFDNDNIYWVSADDAVHSRNIELLNKVFLVVFNSKQDTSKGERSAVCLQTTARALEGADAIAAHTVYAQRFTSSRLPGEGKHLFAAPIGILNTHKTNGQMFYYGPARVEGGVL